MMAATPPSVLRLITAASTCIATSRRRCAGVSARAICRARPIRGIADSAGTGATLRERGIGGHESLADRRRRHVPLEMRANRGRGGPWLAQRVAQRARAVVRIAHAPEPADLAAGQSAKRRD